MTAFSPYRFSIYSRDLQEAILELSREYQMGIKLQGIAAKVAKLQHDAEFEADKLDKKVEGLAEELPVVFSGAHKSVDDLARDIKGVEATFADIKAVTNGGPPIVDQKTEEAPTPAALPVINLVPLAS